MCFRGFSKQSWPSFACFWGSSPYGATYKLMVCQGFGTSPPLTEVSLSFWARNRKCRKSLENVSRTPPAPEPPKVSGTVWEVSRESPESLERVSSDRSWHFLETFGVAGASGPGRYFRDFFGISGPKGSREWQESVGISNRLLTPCHTRLRRPLTHKKVPCRGFRWRKMAFWKMTFFSNQCFDPTCRHVSGMILFGIQGGCFGNANVVVAVCLYSCGMSDLCFELPPKETDCVYNTNKEWNNQHSNNPAYPNNSNDNNKNYHNNHQQQQWQLNLQCDSVRRTMHHIPQLGKADPEWKNAEAQNRKNLSCGPMHSCGYDSTNFSPVRNNAFHWTLLSLFSYRGSHPENLLFVRCKVV